MSTLIERVETISALWRILAGFCPAPSEYQLGTWARQFSDSELEYAFARTARKFSPPRRHCPDAEIIHRYATGILLNERKKNDEQNEHRQPHNNRATATTR